MTGKAIKSSNYLSKKDNSAIPPPTSRRAVDVVAYLERSGYESPLLQLAIEAQRTVAELSSLYGLTLAEAHARRLQILQTLLPYWHQKLPTAVEASVRVASLVVVADPAGGEPRRLTDLAAEAGVPGRGGE